MINNFNNSKYLIKDNYICHAFGKLFDKTKQLLQERLDIKFIILEDISIISVMNKECYDCSYLVKQCELNNINLIIPELTFDISSNDWCNTYKIKAIIEELEKINTKYTLILDGKDTCILKSLNEDFIKKFKLYESDIVYNYMKSRYPAVPIESRDFLKSNNFQYINAGVCIGYTDKLLQFYKECEILNTKEYFISNYNSKPSEQYIIRKVANSTNLKVCCDYMKILFCFPEKIKEIKQKD